jgi:hypothetical protein
MVFAQVANVGEWILHLSLSMLVLLLILLLVLLLVVLLDATWACVCKRRTLQSCTLPLRQANC